MQECSTHVKCHEYEFRALKTWAHGTFIVTCFLLFGASRSISPPSFYISRMTYRERAREILCSNQLNFFIYHQLLLFSTPTPYVRHPQKI